MAGMPRSVSNPYIGCETEKLSLPFDWIHQKVTGRNGMVDFMMLEKAKCPTRMQPLTEKILVVPK